MIDDSLIIELNEYKIKDEDKSEAFENAGTVNDVVVNSMMTATVVLFAVNAINTSQSGAVGLVSMWALIDIL